MTPRFATGSRRDAGLLPANQFGRLVGTFDHATLVPEGGRRPDSHHLFLWVRVAEGSYAGLYECAFNIHSERGSGDAANVLFTERSENLDAASALPAVGFAPTPLSFAELGLEDGDFVATQQGDLQSLVSGLANRCERMAIYGVTYVEGTGIHDVHMNSGSGGSGDRVHQDGALVFYVPGTSPNSTTIAQWVFVKFSNQHIATAQAPAATR